MFSLNPVFNGKTTVVFALTILFRLSLWQFKNALCVKGTNKQSFIALRLGIIYYNNYILLNNDDIHKKVWLNIFVMLKNDVSVLKNNNICHLGARPPLFCLIFVTNEHSYFFLLFSL